MNTEHPHPGGFVPRLGADPSTARYELLTADQAAERVAAVGFDPADAKRMVDQYLAQNTAAIGRPPGDGWRVDPYDLAEIARGYEWVDHYRGETIADARARAARYAAGYQQQAAGVDRERDPGRAARVDREAVEWGDRARDGHNPWPVPDPRLAPVMPSWMAEQAHAIEAAIAAGTHQPPAPDDPAVLVARLAVLHSGDTPSRDSATALAHAADHDKDGDGDRDGDGGGRGRDDDPRPVPLSGPDTAAWDEGTDAHDNPSAAIARADHQPGGERDEAGAGRDDPAGAVWWEPIGTGEVTLSHAEVVAELTRAGMTTDQARAALTRYLDDTSREAGVSVHRWGLDLHDVQAIAATDRDRRVVEAPGQRGPVRGEWVHVRGADYDQMMGDAAALTARPAAPAAPAGVEDQRREQLIRWHGDDHLGAREDGHGDDGAVRGLDDYAPTGATGQEW